MQVLWQGGWLMVARVVRQRLGNAPAGRDPKNRHRLGQDAVARSLADLRSAFVFGGCDAECAPFVAIALELVQRLSRAARPEKKVVARALTTGWTLGKYKGCRGNRGEHSRWNIAWPSRVA